MTRYEEAFEKAKAKFRVSAVKAAEAGIIPYKSENGEWISSPYDGNGWWTGGFWPGLMWQFYAESKEESFLTEENFKAFVDECKVYGAEELLEIYKEGYANYLASLE